MLKPVEQRVNFLLLWRKIFLLLDGSSADISEELCEPLARDEIIAQHDCEEWQHILLKHTICQILDRVDAAIKVIVSGFFYFFVGPSWSLNDNLLRPPFNVLLTLLLLRDDFNLE